MKQYEAIVIGASAGGLNALQELLAHLGPDFGLPLIVVQHRPPMPPDNYWPFFLHSACQLQVKEADEKESPRPGWVYLAPANYHLLVERDKTLSLSVDGRVWYSRPSIDVLFETAAEAYLSGLVGIILSGANSDGTAGLRRIKEKGGLTLAQDPATAEVELMPRAAIQAKVVDQVLSLPQMAALLQELSLRTPPGMKKEVTLKT
jgi:two-component system chemotaxis response regulator CheB